MGTSYAHEFIDMNFDCGGFWQAENRHGQVLVKKVSVFNENVGVMG